MLSVNLGFKGCLEVDYVILRLRAAPPPPLGERHNILLLAACFSIGSGGYCGIYRGYFERFSKCFPTEIAVSTPSCLYLSRLGYGRRSSPARSCCFCLHISRSQPPFVVRFTASRRPSTYRRRRWFSHTAESKHLRAHSVGAGIGLAGP